MSPGADLRLLGPALATWLGVWATLGAPPWLRIAAAAALVLTACSAAVWRWRRARRRAGSARAPGSERVGSGSAALVLIALACGLGLGASGLQAARRDAGSVRALAGQGASVRLEATVAGDPRRLDGPGAVVLVRLAVRAVEGRGERSMVRSRVLVFGDERWTVVRSGERVLVRGRLGPARAGDDVAATLNARGPPVVVRPASTVERGAEQIRRGLRESVASLGPDPRGLLPGLVVGDTSLQPPGLEQAMRATGLTHLSAVSGTNVTIVCALALGLARAARLGRRARLVTAGFVLAGFVVLARPEPSVLRAAVMGAIGLLGLGTARQRAAVPALSASVVLLLVADPWLSRSYGFALSVLATLGLLLFAAPWAEAMSRRGVPRIVALGISVPLSAQVATGPVLVLLSGQLSPVSLPANVLAAPWVAPATVLGLASAMTALVSARLAAFVAELAGLPAAAITLVARRLSTVQGGQVGWPGGARGALALAILTVLAVVLGPPLLHWAGRHRRVAAAGSAVLASLVVPIPSPAGWPPRDWALVACDVGQGDALVLATGPGRAILVDAGPDPVSIDRCLRTLGVRTLDRVVLTHFHADHVAGLPGALRGRRAAEIVVTIVDDPPPQARRVRALASAAGVPVRTVTVGEELGSGPLHARVLWPARVVREDSVPNNTSIVLRVQAGDLRVLLLGEVEPPAARLVARLLQQEAEGPTAEVIKVPHHGSALQDPGLLGATRAGLALIGVGADNPYGHPAPTTTRLLGGLGMRVARTDLEGDLAVVVRAGVPALVTSGPASRRPPRPGRAPPAPGDGR